MKSISLLSLILSLFISQVGFTKNKKVDVCETIRGTFIKTIKAGADQMTVSKGASDTYPIVRHGQGSHCKYIRYAFRTLKKPYNGETVSTREWVEAVKRLDERREY